MGKGNMPWIKAQEEWRRQFPRKKDQPALMMKKNGTEEQRKMYREVKAIYYYKCAAPHEKKDAIRNLPPWYKKRHSINLRKSPSTRRSPRKSTRKSPRKSKR
jgi:hypothetical protein